MNPPRARGRSLVGRATERYRLQHLIENLERGSGASLVIEGEPGVGKTTLLEWLAHESHSVTVLRATAMELGRDLPLAAIEELVSGDTGSRTSDSPAWTAPDRFGTPLRWAETVRDLADRRPVLVLIDDAQWVDRSSFDALTQAATRLADDPVAFVLATRPGHREWPGWPVLEVGGLDDDAACQLLAGTAAPTVARRLAALTEGNPFALLELSTILDADQLNGRTPIDEPLQVPPRVEAAFLQRADTLDAQARLVLLFVAADGSVEPAVLRGALSEHGIEAAIVDALELDGFLTINDKGRVGVPHPLQQAAVYQAADPTDRRLAHRALAHALRRDADLDRRAMHLANSADGPDETIAAVLEASASSAEARGAFAAAGEAFARGGELSSEQRNRARRFAAAGNTFWLGALHERSAEMFDRALIDAADPAQRADVQMLRLTAQRGRSFSAAHHELVSEADSIEAIDPIRAASLYTRAVFPAYAAGLILSARDAAERAIALASDDPMVLGPARIVLATAQHLLGEEQRVIPVFLELAELVATVGARPEFAGVADYVTAGLVWAQQFDVSERLGAQMIEFERATGSLGMLPISLSARAELRAWRGEWLFALADASEAVALAREADLAVDLTFILAQLARLEAGLGRFDPARDHAFEALSMTHEFSETLYFEHYAHAALGFIEVTAQNYEEAVRHLIRVEEVARACHVRNPAIGRWQHDLVLALVEVDELGEARRVARDLTDDAALTEGTAQRGWAAYANGLVATDNGDADDAFRLALELFGSLPMPFDRGRIELAFGLSLRDRGDSEAAAQHLLAARALFERVGAAPWAQRVIDDLAPANAETGPTVSPLLDALSPREFQIAISVADGKTSRDIARELFLSPRTVEHHLGTIYRKLGVHSRVELANLVNAGIVREG